MELEAAPFFGTVRQVGQKLAAIVERVRNNSKGLPSVDLARLNLRVGKPLSRQAAELEDDPELVALAEKVADSLLADSIDGGPQG